MNQFKSMKVIGIHGLERVGKSTAGNFLESLGCYQTSFAKKVYQSVQIMYGLSDIEMNAHHKNVKHPVWKMTLREMLRTVGHDMGRGSREDLWLQNVNQEYLRVASKFSLFKAFVVTDVRYPNEADWVRQHGALLHLRIAGINCGGNHASNTQLDIQEGDYLLDRVEPLSFDDLFDSLETVLKDICN